MQSEKDKSKRAAAWSGMRPVSECFDGGEESEEVSWMGLHFDPGSSYVV
jgi:hypothetical protein